MEFSAQRHDRPNSNVLRENLLLYAVTDRTWVDDRSLVECVEAAIGGGATFVQLREKHAPYEEVVAIARELRALCSAAQVPFVVNDAVDVALSVGADGVHIGQDDAPCHEVRRALGPSSIIGVSVQTIEQALAAQEEGADYVGVGALFKTATKPEAADVTLETLSAICSAVDIPVVAIGGLDRTTIPALAGTGVAGAAVVSAIFAAQDIAAQTKVLHRIVSGAVVGR